MAAILSLMLGFVYREIKVNDLGNIFLDVATNTATFTGLIAAASVLSWVLAFQGVPDLVVEYIKGLTDSPFVFLQLVILMMIILGMFLESISVSEIQRLVTQYRAHAEFEENEFLPLSQTILGRNSNHLAALGLSLHMRHTPARVNAI